MPLDDETKARLAFELCGALPFYPDAEDFAQAAIDEIERGREERAKQTASARRMRGMRELMAREMWAPDSWASEEE